MFLGWLPGYSQITDVGTASVPFASALFAIMLRLKRMVGIEILLMLFGPQISLVPSMMNATS